MYVLSQNFVSAIIVPAINVRAFFIHFERPMDGDIFRASKRIGMTILGAVQLVRVLPSTIFWLELVYRRVLSGFRSSVRARRE